MPVQQEIPEPVQRMVDATNRADSKAFLDSFAADGVVDDWGREFTGRQAISGWNDNENIGVQSHFTIHQISRDDAVYVASVTVKGNGYNGAGTFTFELGGDTIKRFTIR